MSKPNRASKPKLLIEIENFEQRIDQFENGQPFSGVDLKQLRSVKNIHEMKKFDFGNEGTQICHTARKLNRLKKLEQQKINLMNSLQVLKESAVSAIAQKQEEIQKLKMKTSYIQDDDIKVYQQRLYEQRLLRANLEDQKNQLLKELKMERQMHISQLEDKQQIIDQLCAQIDEVKCELQALEETDIAKSKRIRLLQQENQQLSEQLEISTIATALKERSERIHEQSIDLDETIKIKSAFSVASSIQAKKYHSYLQSTQRCFESEIDRSYITQKLQEREKAHKEELLDLRAFYEKRISALRQIYQRELHLPTQSSEKQSVVRRRNGSSCSNSQSYKRNPSKKQIEGLHLNLKDMYSIEEKVQNQLQTSRSNLKNLRNQIKMQNLSECPSLEPRFNTNQDAESQFTTKYFQTHHRILKKPSSSGSITIYHESELKIVSRKSMIQPQSSKCCETKTSEREITNSGNYQPESSKKSLIFGAGVVSGIAITSIVGYMFTKRRF